MYHTMRNQFKFKPYEEISEEEETVVVSDLNVSDVSFNHHFDQESNEQEVLCTSYPSNNDKEETIETEQQIAQKFEQLIIPKFISEINCPHELLNLVDMTVEIRTYVENTSLSKVVEVKKTIGFLVTPFVPNNNRTKVIKFMTCCHAFHENEKVLDLKVVAKNKEFFGTIEQQSRLTIGEGKISERLSERDFAIVSVDLNEERNRQVDTSYCLVSNKCFIPSPIAAHTKARPVGDETPKEYNILHIGQISDLSKIDIDMVQKVFPHGIERGKLYKAILNSLPQDVNLYCSGSTALFSGGPLTPCSIDIEKTKKVLENPPKMQFNFYLTEALAQHGATFTNEVIGIHLGGTKEGNRACSVLSWFEKYYELVYCKHKDYFSEELQIKIEKEKDYYDSIKHTFAGMDE
ncbi:hypothetical protein ABK040_014622 [Willaertia magna]